MDHIARAAGIGRGALYRRYPDRASLARALLDKHERSLQERLPSGAAPLGPGGADGPEPTPAERLAAFYAAMVELLETHVHLGLGAETGAARYRTGAYAFWRLHVAHLARRAGLADPDTVADQLLAPLRFELFRHQRDAGLTPERIAAGLAVLARRVLG